MKQHTPHIEIVGDADAVAERAASLVIATLRRAEVTRLGLATGATMAPLYARLVEACRTGSVSFRNASSFNLDEYLGLPGTHAESFRYFMQENLFRHVNVKPENIHVPDGMIAEIDQFEHLGEVCVQSLHLRCGGQWFGTRSAMRGGWP